MKGLSFIKNVVRKSLPGLLLMMVAQNAVAQQDAAPAYYHGTGMPISKVTFGEYDNKETTRVMLYNVGKDMFLNAGGYWGTRTATFTVGLPLVLQKDVYKDKSNYYVPIPTGQYCIQGPFDNDTGEHIGLNLGESQENKNGTYFDRASNIFWEFVEVKTKNEDGKDDYVYQIKQNGYTLCSNLPMTINVYEKGNNNLVRALTDKEIAEYKEKKIIDDENTYWKIVSLDQVIEQFDNTYIYETSADATFLMRAQGFNRNNRFAEYDEKIGKGWQTSREGLGYNYGFSGEFYFPGTDTDLYAEQQVDPNFGMFYCAGIRKAEKGDKLYQTVELTRSGWYRITCQGFYDDKEGTRTAFANLYASFNGASKAPGGASQPLMSKSKGEEDISKVKFNAETFSNVKGFYGDRTVYYLKDDINDGKISNKIEAGVAFYSGIYPNTVMVYANFPEGETRTLELGIEVTDNMDADDYVYIDDFRLNYLGECFALNEEWTDFEQGSDGNSNFADEYPKHVMILKRKLAAGKWNSICLPVDLTKEQLLDAFSSNVMLAVMCEPKDIGTIEFRCVNLNKAAANDVVMHRGEAYLIKAGATPYTEGSVEIGDAGKGTVEAPYYVIPRVSLTKKEFVESTGVFTGEKPYIRFRTLTYDEAGNPQKDVSYGVNGAAYSGCSLKVYATFENHKSTGGAGTVIPAHAYTFSNDNLYHLTSAYAQKGYSWWIEDEDQDPNNPSSSRHTLTFATYMDGISDNTSMAIEGIPAGIAAQELPQAVYNVCGQAVRRGTASAEGLPGGIYIVNGRKVMVR